MSEIVKSKYTAKQLTEGILSKKIVWLSRGITLVESTLDDDKIISSEMLEKLIGYTGKSLRIGITGVPGVGKSTFIETFGTILTGLGKKIAILSIDPTSALTKGSILGDKTRMHTLSTNPDAYIRPSPSGKTLGGVAYSTQESILLCEAAGFDIIIVETVGVGQSETLVKDMVDFFLLMMLPGSGDELQGIKRGIMEMADGIFINKADGNMERAKRARTDFRNALHLYPPTQSGWEIPVEIGSSLGNDGIKQVWKQIMSFEEMTRKNGYFLSNRKEQQIKWFHQMVRQKLEDQFYSSQRTHQMIQQAEEFITSGEKSVRKAVDELFA